MSNLVDDIIKDVKKNGNISQIGEDGLPSDVKKWISTGSTLLDYAISNQDSGGIPVGKITEISGLEGSGKTLFGMQICANAQKEGALVVYIDSENALNSDFASRVGLDVKDKDTFLYMSINTVEDVFDVMFKIFKRLDDSEKKGEDGYPYVVIVWDSVAATNAREDLIAENPDPTANVGLKPRILSKNIALLIQSTGRKNVAQVFINQLRSKIGAKPFQDQYVTPGGLAIPYASSARVRLIPMGKIKVKDEIVGIKTKAKVVKTRFGPPHRDCEFGIYFTKGVDDTESLIDFMKAKNLIKVKKGGPKGNMFSFESGDLMKRAELKQKMIQDKTFRTKVIEAVSSVAKKQLANPDLEEEQVVNEKEDD